MTLSERHVPLPGWLLFFLTIYYFIYILRLFNSKTYWMLYASCFFVYVAICTSSSFAFCLCVTNNENPPKFFLQWYWFGYIGILTDYEESCCCSGVVEEEAGRKREKLY